MTKFLKYVLIGFVATLFASCNAPDDQIEAEVKTSADSTGGEKSSNLKVAFIYGDTINAKYNFLKDAEAELEKERNVIEQRINRKLRKAENRAMELQQQAATMTQIQIQEAQLELQNLDIEIQQFQEKLASEFRKRELELQEEYNDRVNNLLEEYNEGGTYDLILNFQPGGNLLWVNDSYDITDEILRMLNEQYESDISAEASESAE